MKSAFLLEAYREPRPPCGDKLGLFVVPVFVVALTAASAAATTTGTAASSGTGRTDRLSESVVAAARSAATFAVVFSRSTRGSRCTEFTWRTTAEVTRRTAAEVAWRAAEVAWRTATEVAWRTAKVTTLAGRSIALGMGDVHDQASTAKLGIGQRVRCGFRRLARSEGHEAEAAFATVRVHWEVDANDRVVRDAVDEACDFLLCGVVRQVADVERPVGWWRTATHGRVTPRRTSETAALAPKASATFPRPIAARRIGLEWAHADAATCLERAVKRLAGNLRFFRRAHRHEAKAPWPASSAILWDAHTDNLATGRLEKLPQHVLRYAVWQPRHEQLRVITRHYLNLALILAAWGALATRTANGMPHI